MKKFVRLLSAVALLGMTVTLLQAAPASANHDVCAGNGTAATAVNVYYPVTPGTAPGTLNTPPVNSVPAGTGFSVSLVGVCSESGDIDFQGGSFTAASPIGNYCGHSTGTVQLNGSTGDWVSAASMLVFTGGVAGVVNAIPDATNGHSCATGASGFIVTGALCIHLCDEP